MLTSDQAKLTKELKKAKYLRKAQPKLRKERLYPEYSSDYKNHELYEAFRGTTAIKTVKNEILLKPELKRRAILEEEERRTRVKLGMTGFQNSQKKEDKGMSRHNS